MILIPLFNYLDFKVSLLKSTLAINTKFLIISVNLLTPFQPP